MRVSAGLRGSNTRKAILTPAASLITKTPIESAARSRYDKKPADQFLAAEGLQS